MIFDPMYFLFIGPPLLLGLWAQHSVKSTFARWSEVRSASGMTGAEVARMILDRNGLHGVPVEQVAGQLSDHYDPKTRTVRLSESVHGSRSVAAVSVAAHEVGHAIQHERSYVPMTARSALWPVAAFGSSAWAILLMVGTLLMFFAHSPIGLYVIAFGVIFYSFAVLFHVVTLPVEFNASSRARMQLQELGLVTSQDAAGTAKVLNAAALTYVAGALAALAELAYWLYVLFGSRR